MPTVNHTGVSRKISSDEERQRLKRIIISERENGQGGFIVRTAAAGASEEDLRADILKKLLGATHHVARGLAAVDDQKHAVNERGGQNAIGERADRGRVYDDVRESAFEYLYQAAHLLGADQFRRVRRNRAGR